MLLDVLISECPVYGKGLAKGKTFLVAARKKTPDKYPLFWILSIPGAELIQLREALKEAFEGLSL